MCLWTHLCWLLLHGRTSLVHIPTDHFRTPQPSLIKMSQEEQLTPPNTHLGPFMKTLGALTWITLVPYSWGWFCPSFIHIYFPRISNTIALPSITHSCLISLDIKNSTSFFFFFPCQRKMNSQPLPASLVKYQGLQIYLVFRQCFFHYLVPLTSHSVAELHALEDTRIYSKTSLSVCFRLALS